MMLKKFSLWMLAATALVAAAACSDHPDEPEVPEPVDPTPAAPADTVDKINPPEIVAIKTLVISANGKEMEATFDDNPSVWALKAELAKGPVKIEMRDFGSMEKTGKLPFALPQSPKLMATRPGDVVLYGSIELNIMYDTNTWSYTRIAKINDATTSSLKDVLGERDVAVTISLKR